MTEERLKELEERARRNAVLRGLVNTAYARDVSELVAEVRRLRGEAVRASAELRHTYHSEIRDWNLVARSISILEKATTDRP